MEWVLLLGAVLAVILGVWWVGRRRRVDSDDRAAASRAHADAERGKHGSSGSNAPGGGW